MTINRLNIDQVYQLAYDCLCHNGADHDNADAVASVITKAEGDMCHSHGLFRLPGYVATLKSGKVNGQSSPSWKKTAKTVVQVDSHNGFAPLAHQVGIPLLIDCAKTNGMAALAIIRTHHFSALWAEIEKLTDAGLVGLAFTSYLPSVAPAGGNRPLYGTNPMAFGWPRKEHHPLIFDQASSTLARGEVMIAAREGKTLPEGVGIDKQGNASTDPKTILEGSLLAFGGYKGSSIALMIELLAGPLIEECTSLEAKSRDNQDGGPPQGGEILIAIDPNQFGSGDQATIDRRSERAEELFSAISDQEGARLPSQRRYQNRLEIAKNGVEVNAELHQKIIDLSR